MAHESYRDRDIAQVRELYREYLGAPEAPGKRLRLVATEEAFAIPEYGAEIKKLIDSGVDDPDLYKLWFSGDPPPESDADAWTEWWCKIVPAIHAPKPGGESEGWLDWWRTTRTRLFDLDRVRLGIMDDADIDLLIFPLLALNQKNVPVLF